MDKIAILFDDAGELTTESRTGLTKLRSQLRAKITIWERGLQLGRLPDSQEFDNLVTQLYDIDGYIALYDEEAREQEDTRL